MNQSHHPETGKETAGGEQGVLTEEGVHLLSIKEVFSYGMGGFFSMYGLFFLLICASLVKYAKDEFAFAMKKDPAKIKVRDIGNLTANAYVKLTCELDYAHGLDIKTVGAKDYSLIPVAGTDNRLIIFQSGVTTKKEMATSMRTLTGRIFGKDWADEYDAGANRIKLQDQFARENISVPDDALILASGEKPEFKIWPLVIGLIGASIILHFLNCLRRTIGFLSDRGKLVQYVNSRIDGNPK